MMDGSAAKILLWIHIFPILSFAFVPSTPPQNFIFKGHGIEANRLQRDTIFMEKAEAKAFSQNSRRIIFSKLTILKVKSQEDEGDDNKTTYFSPNIDLNAARKHKLSDAEDEDPTDQEIRESLNEYSFFDEATIYTRAGSGGQGSSTYKKGPGMSNIKLYRSMIFFETGIY